MQDQDDITDLNEGKMTSFRAKTKDWVRRIIVSVVVSYLYCEQELDLCRKSYHLENDKGSNRDNS